VLLERQRKGCFHFSSSPEFGFCPERQRFDGWDEESVSFDLNIPGGRERLPQYNFPFSPNPPIPTRCYSRLLHYQNRPKITYSRIIPPSFCSTHSPNFIPKHEQKLWTRPAPVCPGRVNGEIKNWNNFGERPNSINFVACSSDFNCNQRVLGL